MQNWCSLFKLYRKRKLFYCLLGLIALKKSSLIFFKGNFWPIFFNSAFDLANIDTDRTFHITLYIPCKRHYCYQAVTLSDSCCSVIELCSTLCDPMNCSTSGLPVLHHLPELAKTHVHWVKMPWHLVLCHPLFLPSIFLCIRVFSNQSALRIRYPKYWSYSFSISPSN